MGKCRQSISGKMEDCMKTYSDRSRYEPREIGLFLLLFSSRDGGQRPNPMPEAQSLFRRNSALLRSPGGVNASALLQRAGIRIVRTMVCCGALHRKRACALSLPLAAIPNKLRPVFNFCLHGRSVQLSQSCVHMIGIHFL